MSKNMAKQLKQESRHQIRKVETLTVVFNHEQEELEARITTKRGKKARKAAKKLARKQLEYDHKKETALNKAAKATAALVNIGELRGAIGDEVQERAAKILAAQRIAESTVLIEGEVA